MMSQANLTDFKTIHPVPSATSEKQYPVTEEKGVFTCTCQHFKHHGHKTPCRHILELLYKRAMKRNSYLETRNEHKSKAFFETFEDVLVHLELSNSAEAEYLASLILMLAKSQGEVVSDDIYSIIDGQFSGSGNIMGSTFGLLQKKGLIMHKPLTVTCDCGKHIQVTGYHHRVPSRTDSNHGAMISVWILTRKGEEVLGRL